MIEAKNITKIYKDGDEEFFALKNINLKIEDGDFLIIKGRSGSGKSTLLYQLSLLDEPTMGQVIFNGCDVATLNNQQKTSFRLENLGYIFQDYALIPELTTLENIILPLLMNGQNKKRAKEKALEILKELGLKEKWHNLPNQLSGGEQQRVSIARAIVNDPKVLFADEPTANLDSESGRMVLGELEKLHKKGQTIVMVTHEEEYFKFGNKLVELIDGSIVD